MPRISNRYFVSSARQVDPLSWFTGPLVPITFTVLELIYGSVLSVLGWNGNSRPWLQFVATALCACSGLIVHIITRGVRREVGWLTGGLALVPATAGMIISAIGYSDSAFAVEFWWAPPALALMIASLGPYLAVRQIVILGSTATAVAVFASLIIVHPTSDRWGPIAVGLIVAYPPLLGTAATAVFSYTVVSTVIRMLESPSRIMVPGQKVRDEAAEHVERATIARLTARATPFLEGIAAAGRIAPSDRALAGQLARRLRDDLVTQSNLTWLESIASESRLVVVDPGRRASRMSNAQRTALHAMLRAVVDTPAIDSGSLMVELREGPDGATAVAVSLDMALPEGRRIMHLAPYYLTLRMTVDDLKIETDRLLRVSFNVANK